MYKCCECKELFCEDEVNILDCNELPVCNKETDEIDKIICHTCYENN